jgi:hypothetical protein
LKIFQDYGWKIGLSHDVTNESSGDRPFASALGASGLASAEGLADRLSVIDALQIGGGVIAWWLQYDETASLWNTLK